MEAVREEKEGHGGTVILPREEGFLVRRSSQNS